MTTRRCHRPASKFIKGANGEIVEKKDSYCPEHTRRALIAKQIVGFAPPQSPAVSAASAASALATPSPSSRKRRRASTSAPATSSQPSHIAAHKYIKDLQHYERVAQEDSKADAEAKRSRPRPDEETLDLVTVPSSSQRAFDGGFSEVDDDEEDAVTTVQAAFRGDGEDSDAESVDSDFEDPLKHAGAYSAEEVIRMMRDKLIRLQKLYIDQFQRLQYLLREERRRYCHLQRKESCVVALKLPKSYFDICCQILLLNRDCTVRCTAWYINEELEEG